MRASHKTGIGFDLHRLTPTLEKSAIALGGVEIPCYFKLEAHSDGDVLLHAAVDACLGALALGDIGQWFPDNAPENRGRPSHEFITRVIDHIQGLGWKVAHFDSVVMLEAPKLAPHAENIRRRLAALLRTELTSVSLKAKTMEGLGPIGEKRAIAAQVLVTLLNEDKEKDEV